MASSTFPHTFPTNMSAEMIFCLNGWPPMNITCHERPYLSCAHPYLSLKGYAPSSMSTEPPRENFSHNASTSSLVSQQTKKETDGLNLKSGPALMAMNV